MQEKSEYNTTTWFCSSTDASETCTSGIRVSSIFSSFTATLIFCVIPMIGNWIRNYERMKFERRWEDWVRGAALRTVGTLGLRDSTCSGAISLLDDYQNKSKTASKYIKRSSITTRPPSIFTDLPTVLAPHTALICRADDSTLQARWNITGTVRIYPNQLL